MHTDLELSGKKRRTQQAYLRAIRKLSALIDERFSHIVAYRSANVAYDGHIDRRTEAKAVRETQYELNEARIKKD